MKNEKQFDALNTANQIIAVLLANLDYLSDYDKEKLSGQLTARGINLEAEKLKRAEVLKQMYSEK